MLAVSRSQLTSAALAGNPAVIDAIASQSAAMFAKYAVTNRNRALGFLSTAYEETGGFRELAENLNYSARRLVEVWPSRFPTLGSAAPFARNPQALANKVYGGRMGNSGADDGWLYRGRGLIQCTGRNNYALLQKRTGLPVLAQPDLVASPERCLECALALFAEYDGIFGYCDRAAWMSVWALVGTGSAAGKVINLANHQAALAKLAAAIPELVDVAAPPAPAPPPPPPAPSPAPPDIPLAPAPAAASLSLWARLRAYIASIFAFS